MSSFVFLSYKLQPYFKCNYIKIIFVDYEKTFCCLNQTRNASANMTHVLLINITQRRGIFKNSFHLLGVIIVT